MLPQLSSAFWRRLELAFAKSEVVSLFVFGDGCVEIVMVKSEKW